MALSQHNNALMCRLFPSSLGEVALRWFNQIDRGTIASWDQMAEAFVGRFITNSRKPKGMHVLMTMKLGHNESIKNYAARYSETYNDIEGCGEDVAVPTFKLGLPIDSEEDKGNSNTVQAEALVRSPNIKPPAQMNKIPRVATVSSNFVAPSFKAHITVFKEPIYWILDKIKAEPFFIWPPKMPGDPATRSQRPICSYHRERGHLTENCYKFKSHLDQLVSDGHLSEYVNPDLTQQAKMRQSDDRPGSSGTAPTGYVRKDHVSSVNGTISFSDSDLHDVQLPHNDPLVITLRIGNYDVKRVLVDEGSFAEEFRDVFAWSVYEAPGVSPDLACHSLALPSDAKPIQQRRRKLAPEISEIIMEEVRRLLAAEVIQPVLYPTWLSNTVVVQKKNGKLRVCVDFTDLNKGYHQIPMTPLDQEKMAFITPRGAYCYKVMPFRLKNARATYQRMMTTMFRRQIGKTVEVYIDDMLVKSVRKEDHLAHLREVFEILRRDELCLNDSKCLFGVHSGKFLGHIISNRGIEANPDQISALMNLEEPKNSKQVQRLTGMVAALGRFISRSADKCRPFFRLLGKKRKFLWDEDCSAAFQGIKAYLSSPPCLSIPSPGEPLYLYLAVSEHAVSAVLVRETSEYQRPIFFISKTMTEVESRYLPLEKAALALVRAVKKLPQYFQATTVTVLTDLPLKALLQCSDFSGRITRWGVQLGSLGVEYKSRTSIKGQVLANFVAEFQGKDSESGPTNSLGLETNSVSTEWKFFVDGALNTMGSGAGVVLISPEGLIMEQAVRLNFLAPNNESEYEALLIGLKSARRLGADRLRVEQIGREYNSHADILAKLATAMETDMQRTMTVEVLNSPSSQDCDSDILCTISPVASWMDPLIAYLQNDQLPEDRKEADIIKRKAPGYWLSKEGSLYKRSFSGPYLLCVHPDLVNNLLYEIHEGICGSHTGGRSLAHRAMSQGYWWPYMQSDSVRYVKACDKCQRFAPKIHQPARELNPLSSPWPFVQWGIDIVGPLPRAPGNKKFLIVATDYFTKWVEAEPLAHIRDADAKFFLWKNVVTRFGIPWAVISDNGTQFEGKVFKGFCSGLGIRNFFSSPGYPQANGQVEVSNKVILDGIKKRLEEAKGKWVEELPSVLWTHRTTHRRSTGETPFVLAYGVEAVIPLEVGLPTIRTAEFDAEQNENNLRKDLNLIEERRDIAAIRLTSYQRQMKRGYDKNIRPRSFQINDLVLRKIVANTRNPNDGKLGRTGRDPIR
uniref:Integrase catalytic domain-containing protein n=1 Tax=Fagus sylvatica TaxID=28930 RepID=A0A2N9IBS0_FAGSY